ncbi:HAD family hydrolase [Sphingomonas jatrophae]|uniref:Haloacid dehalogenase superfamily, subfamily IA, variant 3 with third motif having DD or ED n=1 Tax=Sphingomonas jatrophae TaxID=1166337 RepID=A0A1I6JYQ9_9SPHN|nr:HAD family phosphatase [Sphingomonas jatrophae]SFR84115.1 haloacid dehalogenase superfamily, subfamily IA, variant 3 with third motif having DD or ED [Sphingomonas jatrophae]
MTCPAALLFDFDGVLVESEYSGNAHVAAYLTGIGHPTTPEQAMASFMGLSGQDFLSAIEAAIGRSLPDDFHSARQAENERVMREGIDGVAGAIAFVRALPADLPRAIVSSSSTAWITRHLDHVGLRDAFEGYIYSGKEHVARGKPAPDIYLHAAEQLGVPIQACAILEDSPVGVTGAVASGARVIGLCAGLHCGADHGAALRRLGVTELAADFGEVSRLLDLPIA